MQSFVQRFLGRLAAAFLLCQIAVPASAEPPPPIADFFRVPDFLQPVLSPDGRYLAAAVGGPSGRKRLGVIDLENRKLTVVAGYSDVDVYGYQWVNERRLVFSTADIRSVDSQTPPGLWAVDLDGKNMRELIQAREMDSGSARTLDWRWSLFRVLRDGSDDVVVVAPQFDGRYEQTGTLLRRQDTRTGLWRALSAGTPDNVSSWVLDTNGEPAALTTFKSGRFASYLKSDKGWQRWEEGDGYKDKFSDPYWIGPQGELLVLSTFKGFSALFSLNRETKKLSDAPLVSLQGYDYSGVPVYDRGVGRLLGFHYESDALGTIWLDEGMRKMQAEIDRRLPATSNRIGCERCTSVPSVLVSASSDSSPPRYYLYHREKGTLEHLADAMSWIKPAQMGTRDMYRFAARDGLSIPVLVTQPAVEAKGPRPAVVLVHGGPWVRGAHWAWEPSAQFLASRGYVVIEPEFRGSTGYGAKHFQASWKQWGLSMQDDVADAVKWAVKQGWVDANRVCIAGASYGGYATLMGLIKNPELYRCGVDWVGVSDINLMYSITWSDSSSEWQQYGMPVLVGDREKDAKQLKETSPLEQAGRLTRPLLMAYGGMDRRVPIKHGTAFRDAVPKGTEVEWIEYPKEGHGWFELGTNVDFWGRVEKFLDRHIGAGAVR